MSLALFAFGSAIVAVAPSFDLVLLGRAVQAFGAGGIFPVASAMIGATAPPARRGRALGMLGAAFGVAFLVGPLLGGLLLRWDWRWLFLINLPVAAVLIAAARRLLSDARAARARGLDALGTLLFCTALAALVWGINQIDGGAIVSSMLSTRVWPFALLAALALPALWSVEKRAADPLLPPELFRSLQLRVVGAIALAAGLVEAGMVFLPNLAVLALGVAAPAASLMMLPLVMTLIVGAPVAGHLLDKIGARIVVQGGLVLTILGLSLFALLPLTLASFYAAGASIGLGLSSLLGAPLRYVTLNEAGDARRGAGQGLLTLFLSVGQLVGAALIGGLAASSSSEILGYRTALSTLAVICAVALALSAWLRGRAAANDPDAA
jgi:MFS family permease